MLRGTRHGRCSFNHYMRFMSSSLATTEAAAAAAAAAAVVVPRVRSCYSRPLPLFNSSLRCCLRRRSSSSVVPRINFEKLEPIQAEIDSRVNGGAIHLADQSLQLYRTMDFGDGHVKNLLFYNMVIEGWATFTREGNFIQAMNVMKNLRSDGLVPDVNSYIPIMYMFSLRGDTQGFKVCMKECEVHSGVMNTSDLIQAVKAGRNNMMSNVVLQGITTVLSGKELAPKDALDVVSASREREIEYKEMQKEETAKRAKNIYSNTISESSVQHNIREIEISAKLRIFSKSKKPPIELEQTKLASLLSNTSVVENPDLSPFEKQRELEARSIDVSVRRYHDLQVQLTSLGLSDKITAFQKLVYLWMDPVTEGFCIEQARSQFSKKRDSNRTNDTSVMLSLLQPSNIAVITIEEVLRSFWEKRDRLVPTRTLARSIGSRIYEEYVAHRIRSLHKGLSHDARKSRDDALNSYVKYDAMIRRHVQKKIISPRKHRAMMALYWRKLQKLSPTIKQELDMMKWPLQTRIDVGTKAINILVKYARLDTRNILRLISMKELSSSSGDVLAAKPAFSRVSMFDDEIIRSSDNPVMSNFIMRDGIQISQLCMDDELFDYISTCGIESTWICDPTEVPMVMKPLPWTDVRGGCYLNSGSHKTALIRSMTAGHFALLRKNESQIGEIFDALNVLGSTPWSINRIVLDTMITLWNNGGANDVKVPMEIDLNGRDHFEFVNGMTWEEKNKLRLLLKEERETQALRVDFNYRLVVARAFASVDKFYLPHSLDFRGRAYPIPSNLNQMSGDTGRSLLIFANGKPLGSRGLFWLHVHIANLAGANKMSYEDRVSWTESRIDMIHDSAENPLGGKQWWRTVENPFQVLGACLELSNALKSPNPEEFISHIPVQMDGSCNGLQHYAALGGDPAGARAVNLMPSDKPQDVYQAVCDIVNENIKNDMDSDKADVAKLVGSVNRKVVKQTVMTNVYGVTFVGAVEQIRARLSERSEEAFKDEKILQNASVYVTRHVFNSIGTMFFGAQQLQNWLHNASKQIATAGEFVQWYTPLGLPVVQPYAKEPAISHDAKDKNLSPVKLPNIRKQNMAFPPNFVHSLDSTHMLMSAVACSEANIEFAAVHDSFWTHAADTDVLHKKLRESFVKMYQQPIMKNLHNHFSIQYEGMVLKSSKKEKLYVEFDPLPERGSFNVEEVLKSEYFFS